MVGGTGLEPVKPSACKADALPTELTAQESALQYTISGLGLQALTLSPNFEHIIILG